MKEGLPRAIRREDYTPPTHLVETTALRFELDEQDTRVSSVLKLRRNPEGPGGPLRLDGQHLALEALEIDGEALSENAFSVDDEGLTIHELPEHCDLRIVTRIDPAANTALEGLYRSGGMYCTQCEAQGFRRISYYPDRPDVMSRFTTTIVGDAAELPVMLSNGNEVGRRVLEDGRTEVVWEDPFPKPAYLFALVAGDLSHIEDGFRTASGRDVVLRIYTEPHNIGQVDYAMGALKRSMRWDEEVYGREYDLDIFMIVAVDDFNMGAMENKGLNIFNTSCVLATPETTTDQGFQRVEAVVAHEYFHNWSGNRVTCRDWFQLSLKEGFTVLRDAQFSADMNSATIKRIEDANFLRTAQFAEDAGPMAHPVRPDSYIEISNFYTLTVYEKGAEVVRMIRTLLGPERFRAGTDLYFERHDGQAVTCDDFVRAMEDASGVDLGRFRRWYEQSGTPELTIDAVREGDELVLTIAQSCPPTPGQPEKSPFHIPFALGLLDDGGRELLGAAGAENGVSVEVETDAEVENPEADGTLVVHLTEPSTRIRFRKLPGAATPSLLRGFSAPVRLHADRTLETLAFLAAHDSDGFARWDAAQDFYARILLAEVDSPRGELPSVLFETVEALLAGALAAGDDGETRAMYAAMLTLPSEEYLGQAMKEVDVEGIHAARERVRRALAERFAEQWSALCDSCEGTGAYVPDAPSFARRSLGNLALGYLALASDAGLARADRRYHAADNMTDRLAALRTIVWSSDTEQGEALLADFLERYRDEALVVDQWIATQALRVAPETLAGLRELAEHEVFDARNPNKLRALVAVFCNQNPVCFHAADGAGYDWLVEWVLSLNGSNPQIAARLLTPLTRWQRYPAARAARMRAALERIAAEQDLSPDVFEIVSKSLDG